MDTLHLVDPADRDYVAQTPPFDPDRQSLADLRAAMRARYGAMMPPCPDARTEHRAPVRDGAPDVRLLVYRPAGSNAAAPAIVYFHGGGFVAGAPDLMDAANLQLAQDSDAVVVAVAYRLAPETVFPGAVEDGYAALRWVAAQAGMLGVDPARIAVMGRSAGGGIAAATALLARDRNGPALAAQILVYPMLDARTGTPEAPIDNPATGEFVWTRSATRFGWNALRGDAPIDPERIGHFSPALAGDLSGLPPAFIGVGSVDLFVEEDVAYALRLARAGVPVDLRVYAGGVHAFDTRPGATAARFHADILAAIKGFAG